MYILICIGPYGTKVQVTDSHKVPKELVQPGEVVFTVQPLDVFARHMHEVGNEPTLWSIKNDE